MIAIIGLGNPDKIYEKTHHNMGYLAIDFLAEKLNFKFTKSKYNANIAEGVLGEQKIIMLKPTTYMNLSGDSVLAVVKKLNIPVNQICVIYDDIDLEIGVVRYRKSGSAGTHNGMRDIVNKLKSQDFARVRIGIGKPQDKPLADYVLSKISKNDEPKFNEAFKKANEIIIEFIKSGGNLEAKSV